MQPRHSIRPYCHRQFPNTLFVTTYNGLLARKFFATLQYSQKKQQLQSGGSSTRLRRRRSARAAWRLACRPRCTTRRRFSVLWILRPQQQAVHRQRVVPLAKRRTGTHDVKGGGEFYRATNRGGNSQSATDYVFQSDYLVVNGKPALDASNIPFRSLRPVYHAFRTGCRPKARTINIDTTSLYVQDHWVATPTLKRRARCPPSRTCMARPRAIF
jgi:hypothetical protein